MKGQHVSIWLNGDELAQLKKAFPDRSPGMAVKTAVRLNFMSGAQKVWRGDVRPGDFVAVSPGGKFQKVFRAKTAGKLYTWKNGCPTELPDFVWKNTNVSEW